MMDLAQVAQLVDKYIQKQTERLSLAKKVAKLEEEEQALKKILVDLCITSKARSLGGSIGQVNYHRENKPTVAPDGGWEKLYAYIREHNAFELLQKRLGEKAVQERWEDEIIVPGVITFPVDKLTIAGRS